jgi:hypothetical protein
MNARWLPLTILLFLGVAACEPGGSSARAARKARPASFQLPAVEIELQRGTDPRELVRIGTRGVAVGTVKQPLEWKLFAEPRRADEAWYLLRTYAPFRENSPAGSLAFHGQGKVKAEATERRMVREWTRQVASEAAGGRTGAAYGLAFSWHQGGSSGVCSDVVVYLTGEATATACGWPGESHGRLEPAALGRLYAWFDRLQPFQAGSETQEGPNPHTALDTRLIFAGGGTRPATAAEQEEVQAFAAELFAELAARKGAVPPPPSPEAPAPGKPAPKPVPAEPPPARLLLPTSAMSPRMEEAPLQFPEKPPPVPPGAAAAPTSPPPPGAPVR